MISFPSEEACQVAQKCKGPYKTAKKAIMAIFVQCHYLYAGRRFRSSSLHYADILEVIYLIDNKYKTHNLDAALRSLLYEKQLHAVGDGSYAIHPMYSQVALPTSHYNSVKAKIDEQEKLRKDRRKSNHFIYYVRWENDPCHVKIGYSTNVADRVSGFLTSSPHKLEVLRVTAAESQEEEMRLHYQFRQHRVAGEWFKYEEELKKHISLLDVNYALTLGLDKHPRILVHCF
jgi:hypothetical protein